MAYHLRLKFTHECREVAHQLIIASRNERSVNGSNHAIHTRISPEHVALVLSVGLKLTLNRIKGVLSTSGIACQCLSLYLLTQGAVCWADGKLTLGYIDSAIQASSASHLDQHEDNSLHSQNGRGGPSKAKEC